MGLTMKGRFYSWAELDVTPNEQVKRLLRREREDGEKAGKRAAEKAYKQAEATREQEKTLTPPADARSPRYFGIKGRGWVFHVWHSREGGFVDTGLHPGPRGAGEPPPEWQKALAKATESAIDQFRSG
jgi:hypothetical protein